LSTAYHACYFAHELRRKASSDDIDKLSMSLFDASVDLTPHQVEAALFVFRSPLSKGVLLADEVGLGKTIEAGLVLCQLWAEKKRRLLVICPASLRKQWSMELEEKFNLPALILENKNYRQMKKDGYDNPFEQEAIIITSINYASRMQTDIRTIPWDIVVIDEAHKLRNAYRPSNRMGQSIKWAIEDRKKILLTATPLQNSLLELFGLSTIIDDYIFGDIKAFRSQFINDNDIDELRERLRGFCQRTLRSQVLEYVRYTERRAITRPFRPSDEEQKLYESIAGFLQREDNYAIPPRQRTLTTLILWKLLASSSQAVAGTLLTIKERLEKIRDGIKAPEDIVENIIDQEEMENDLLDEDIENQEAEYETDTYQQQFKKQASSAIDLEKLKAEIAELDDYIRQAKSIEVDGKTQALLTALEVGFTEMEHTGADRKALIFTESRRTQEYLYHFLQANDYQGSVMMFNGSNNDTLSKEIYRQWLMKNQDTAKISGSKTADKRAALIEYFQDNADIMIATESAAEGVNLQFCSLVINYDLPWNPQRIEQRIGRCHRYGQKHDVVVINFLNERNRADLRVYQILQEKFNLFNGVFGASDEVLGTIESGVDFERKILNIYQQCRTPDEIEAAFSALQEEMENIISSRMEDTRRALLENFDEDVHQHLKIQLDKTRYYLDRVGKQFWELSRYILQKNAVFNDEELSFTLQIAPSANTKAGKYMMINKDKQPEERVKIYRLSGPLGEYVLDQGILQETPAAELQFNISQHPSKISVVEALMNKSGYLVLSKLTIESFEEEEHLLFNAYTDDGQVLDQECCEKLFQCRGRVTGLIDIPHVQRTRLEMETKRHAEGRLNKSLEISNHHFRQERDRLDKWADDMVLAAEKNLKDSRAKIKLVNRQARNATNMEEQLQYEKKLQELNRALRKQRQQIFDLEDEIVDKRDRLIDELERKMGSSTEHRILYMLRFHVI